MKGILDKPRAFQESCRPAKGLPFSKHPLTSACNGLLIPLLLLTGWWAGSRLGLWNPFLLPGPLAVARSAARLILNGELLRHVLASSGRIVLGFGISCMLALPLGVLLGLSPGLGRLFYPTLEFVRHVPPLALLPLLILWFGIGEGSKMVVILLATFFPVFLNTLDGVRRCPPELVEVGQSLRLSPFQVLRRIVLPSALPPVMTGLRLGLGYSWRALIGAELIAAASGLGYLIHDAEALSRSDVIVVGVLALGLLGGLTDHLFFRLTRRLMPWKGGDRSRDGWD